LDRLQSQPSIFPFLSKPHNHARRSGIDITHQLHLLFALIQVRLIDADRVNPQAHLLILIP
jgi:hypothetical protein